MSGFLRAALLALGRTYGGAGESAARIERASVDVVLGAEREMVAFTLRGAELSWTCTCRKDGCAHAHAALLLLAGVEAPPTSASSAANVRVSQQAATPGAERMRSSQTRMAAVADPRVVTEPVASAPTDHAALCEALSDLVTAAVRSGTSTGASASVEEVLARLLRLVPSPPPAGLSRWGGRLKAALAAGDTQELARLLHAGGQLADDLRANALSGPARARVLSWLGVPGADSPVSERLTDATLIEIGRERVPGLERAGIERRYLLNPEGGAIYCEERSGNAAASLGPSPRQLNVWLSLVDRGAPPPRVRLLQYAVTPTIEAESWQRVHACAQRDFERLATEYRETLAQFAGLYEPCVLLAPAKIDADGVAPALIDTGGRVLPLLCRERPAFPDALRDTLRSGQLQWIAGRLLDRDGAIGFLPISTVVQRHGRLCFVRM